MRLPAPIALSWRTFWTLRKRHDGPGWARLLIASGLAMLAWAGLCLLGLAGLLSVDTSDPAFVQRLLAGVFLLFQAIALTMLALVRAAEWLLPAGRLAALSPVRNWRSALWVSGLLVIGIMAGNVVGSGLLALLYPDSELFASSALRRQIRFLQFLPFLALAHGIFWRLRLQRYALQAQAAEAQLRLLHAQIEPHFLFNTLATIETLLDAEPARGRMMLEAFSDHLRSSLAQLRGPETTLGAELEMVGNYLRLLQIRMGRRLVFSIDASPEARAALLPPLLLQPLVENAIRHGLEPNIDGGAVRIHACVGQGRLAIRVDDDGLGLQAPRRAPQPGAGMALENIRARLRHRYGPQASLVLAAGAEGASATLDLPYHCTP
ncbi:sensor histidine kinase [Telluria beijingensis]|uniref:sensor histidine kinase n=1 Tax=Telluria beijingensis TaxID=3068633 RepID=UPI002795BA9F|nr:histidine kinase [Massilia sp. REN29]